MSLAWMNTDPMNDDARQVRALADRVAAMYTGLHGPTGTAPNRPATAIAATTDFDEQGEPVNVLVYAEGAGAKHVLALLEAIEEFSQLATGARRPTGGIDVPTIDVPPASRKLPPPK